MGLVTRDGDSWMFRRLALFPKAERTFYKNFHKEIRVKATNEYIQPSHPDRLFYTSFFEVSKQDKAWIAERIRNCLSDISIRLANPKDQTDDIVFLCMDFFQV